MATMRPAEFAPQSGICTKSGICAHSGNCTKPEYGNLHVKSPTTPRLLYWMAESAQKAKFAQKAEFAQTMKRHNSEEKHLTIRFFSYFKHNNKALFDMTRDVHRQTQIRMYN